MKNLCSCCRHEGYVIHQGVKDYYFNHDGEWNFLKCSNKECGLVWIHPAPEMSKIHKYYTNYYTHNPGGIKNKIKSFITSNIASVVISQNHSNDWNKLVMRLVKNSYPCLVADTFYGLGGVPPFGQKCVLDVGCGNGERLPLFQQVGWKIVAGVDIDDNAVIAANKLGRDVSVGMMSSLPYESNSFDLLFLHHVVEHVYDIEAGMRECFRVLRSGGKVVILTPNANSRLHQYYGKYWRGLEAPRHLQIYTLESLAKVTGQSGFTVSKSETIDRSHLWIKEQCEKTLLREGGTLPQPTIPNLTSQSGEELFLTAIKP